MKTIKDPRLHSLMDSMTDHWGHLLTAPDPEAGQEPPQGGEVVADHEEPAGEVVPADADMLRASRALLEAKREAILKLGFMMLGWDVSYKYNI